MVRMRGVVEQALWAALRLIKFELNPRGSIGGIELIPLTIGYIENRPKNQKGRKEHDEHSIAQRLKKVRSAGGGALIAQRATLRAKRQRNHKQRD